MSKNGPTYTCPYARTESGTMLILCARGGGAYCGHLVWRRCKGWAENSKDAAVCAVRIKADEDAHGAAARAHGKET